MLMLVCGSRFLFDNKSQAHVYYRWKLFSILQVGKSIIFFSFPNMLARYRHGIFAGNVHSKMPSGAFALLMSDIGIEPIDCECIDGAACDAECTVMVSLSAV